MLGGSLPTQWRFQSQLSTGTELLDFGARMYSPSLGRFISPDTIVPRPGDPQSFNRFAAMFNNPLRYRDPSGHDPEDAIAFLAGVAYGLAKANREAIPIPVSDTEQSLMKNIESLAVDHQSFTQGRIVGDVIAVVQGVAEATSGGGTAGGGVLACASGVGCPAGAVAIAGGAVAIYHGSATALRGAGDAAQQLALLSRREIEPRKFTKEEVRQHIGNAPDIGPFGDKGYMDWGKSPQDALRRAETITKQELDSFNFTVDDAKFWKDFYINESKRWFANRELHSARIRLMERAIELLEGGD